MEVIMILQIRPVLGGFHLSCQARQEDSASAAPAARHAYGNSAERINIIQKKLTDSAKLIRSGGETVIETEILRENGSIFYLASEQGEECARGKLTCHPCSGAVSLIRPPQGVHLDILTPDGRLEADRQKDQSVLFVRDSTVIGKISPFFSIRPQIFACADDYPAVFWAAMYVFASYMMHEGDVDIV